MTFFTDTPEKQALRDQFKQEAEAKRLALKNTPKLAKAKKEKK